MPLEGQARKDYAKQHYADNKLKYFKAAKALGQRKRDFINDLKSALIVKNNFLST